MKPHAFAESMIANSSHLRTFGQLMSRVNQSYFACFDRRGYGRLIMRSVRILEVLLREAPKAYDDLQFLSPRDCHWVFLYTQSGTRIEECVRLIKNMVARKEGTLGKAVLQRLAESEVSKRWRLLPFQLYPLSDYDSGDENEGE